jgi:hypothetical protein
MCRILHNNNRSSRYNVTLRSVRATNVAVEKVLSITHYASACNLNYPACNAHVPYCRLWSVPLYNIFNIISNSMIPGKKVLDIKLCFDFFYSIFSETFLILRRTERDMIKILIVLNVKYTLFLPYCNKNWIFLKYFGKIFKYQTR